LSAFLAVPDETSRKLVGTANALERLFREVRGRTDPMVIFYDRTSLERIMFSVFTYLNQKQGSGAPSLS
jgi:transposase-like protein